jgi:3-dehydrosphinganine reductase
MFFVEMTEEDLVKGMNDGYWIQAWTAWVSLYKLMRPYLLTATAGGL